MQNTIERQMIFKAPRQKVWNAITNPQFISKWFALNVDMTKLVVGGEIIFHWKGSHGYSRAIIEVLEPTSQFAYRWENNGVNQSLPVSEVPKTLVSFILEEVDEGTRLTLTETGFEALMNTDTVFQENSKGWDNELKNLQNYVEAA